MTTVVIIQYLYRTSLLKYCKSIWLTNIEVSLQDYNENQRHFEFTKHLGPNLIWWWSKAEVIKHIFKIINFPTALKFYIYLMSKAQK